MIDSVDDQDLRSRYRGAYSLDRYAQACGVNFGPGLCENRPVRVATLYGCSLIMTACERGGRSRFFFSFEGGGAGTVPVAVAVLGLAPLRATVVQASVRAAGVGENVRGPGGACCCLFFGAFFFFCRPPSRPQLLVRASVLVLLPVVMSASFLWRGSSSDLRPAVASV